MATVGILTALVTVMRRDKYKIICLKTTHSLQHGMPGHQLPLGLSFHASDETAKDREVSI